MSSEIKFVPLGMMRVSPIAQRKERPAWRNEILKNLDLEKIGLPVVNFRDSVFYIIDGQHRIGALREFLGEGWETQQIECRVYSGLNEQQEADMFDLLNSVKQVSYFDRFQVRVTAGREIETAVKNIVESVGLHVSRNKTPGAVSAVSALIRIYGRSNAAALRRTLHIARDAFGDSGMESRVLDGLGHLCQRYNGVLNDKEAVERLGSMRGGVSGLLSRAEVLKKQTGHQIAHCVTAAAVDTINAKRGGKKLPSWWKTLKNDEE